MKVIFSLFLYHIFLIAIGLYLCFNLDSFSFYKLQPIWVHVGLFGLVGGCTYCIRGFYLQYCVRKEWDNRWIVWHIIRPFVSTICGVISLLFIKSGLLLLEAVPVGIQNHYGVYALAFIAGLNVDNFIKKIESIFKEITGIKQSRASGGE